MGGEIIEQRMAQGIRERRIGEAGGRQWNALRCMAASAIRSHPPRIIADRDHRRADRKDVSLKMSFYRVAFRGRDPRDDR
jgi:hypothetical protein